MPPRDVYLAAKVREWARWVSSDYSIIYPQKPEQARRERSISPPPDQLGDAQHRSMFFNSLLRREMEWHGLLPHWKVLFDNARTRAGRCNFSTASLTFSRNLVAYASPREMRNIILHEIAHALAGPEHAHNKHWREIALHIGCDGERCHTLQLNKPRWILCCPRGCWRKRRFQRSIKSRACKRCGASCVYSSAWNSS